MELYYLDRNYFSSKKMNDNKIGGCIEVSRNFRNCESNIEHGFQRPLNERFCFNNRTIK